MGLDMFMYATKRDSIGSDGREILGEHKEIGYWRKVRHIHNFFEKVYRDRGGEKIFNCIPLELTAKDLDSLERAIDTGKIREYSQQGFFFGDGDFNSVDAKETKETIKLARDYMARGYSIEYDSWW